MLNLKNLLSKSKAFLEYVTLIGLIFTAYSYFQNNKRDDKKDRVAHTIEFIKEYASNNISSALVDLGAFWKEKVDAVIANTSDASADDVERIYNILLVGQDHYPAFERNLETILDHFDLVVYCVTQKLCEPSLIDSFYCRQYDLLYPIIRSSRNHFKAQAIENGNQAVEYFDRQCRSMLALSAAQPPNSR